MNCHTIGCDTYKDGHHCAHQVPLFLALTLKPLTLSFTALLHCAHSSCTMVGESYQTLLATSGIAVDTKMISDADSDEATASSSSKDVIEKMMRKDVPVLTDYWKKSKVTKADRAAYHTVGWLFGGVESFVPDLEFPR
jgi:hypothetical protein